MLWDRKWVQRPNLSHCATPAPPPTPNPISNYFPLLSPSSSWAISYALVPEYAMQAPRSMALHWLFPCLEDTSPTPTELPPAPFLTALLKNHLLNKSYII